MPVSVRLLPEGTRLLHIGPHKTGSTAIQVALFEARDELARYGVYVPGGARRRREASQELFAARPSFAVPLPLWTALAAEIAGAGDLRVCVSDELFGKARRRTVRKIVDDLGGQHAHILAVARRYDAYLPSQWQERVKAGRTESYEDWLRILFADEPHWEKQNVWTAHDTVALVNRWVTHVGNDRFSLAIGDEIDREQLPRLFEELLGLPVGILVADPARSNQSLTLAEVELMRMVNAAMVRRGLSPREYRGPVNAAVLATVATNPLPTGPHKPALPPWAAQKVRDLSAARVEAVQNLGVRVIGDAQHLRYVEPPGSTRTGAPPIPDGLVTRVLNHALTSLQKPGQ
jgi:hypothetical protein